MAPHLLTVDVDDRVGRSRQSASASERFVDQVIARLAAAGARATFFVPESVATDAPTTLLRICEAGHHVGCLTRQSFAKRPPYDEELRKALVRSRREVENATGRRVTGHRATGFSLTSSTEWIYDVLIDEGFEYDSSRLPHRAEYGVPAVPSSPHSVRRWCGTIIEVPPTITTFLAMQLQLVATPAITRFPLIISRQTIRRRERRGDPAVIHLRQSDVVNKTSVAGGTEGAGRMPRALRCVGGLVRGFEFTSIEEALPELSRTASVIES